MKRSPLARLWPNATAVVLFIGFAFPVYWMFTTAFKPTSDVISEDPVWFPTSATLDHFQKALNARQLAGRWGGQLARREPGSRRSPSRW
ncbi:Sugar ABC transporter permease OS=Streptomyces antimycoticus OX=68175 GN=SANT12839_062800 PE=3 SV=1 [Streptomyces antimycoticus]